MTKLTDLQSLLLAHAAARASGSLYALPESVTAEPARVMKAVSQLLRRDLLEEREVTDKAAAHREDGDLRYGAFITAAGLAAIEVEALAEMPSIMAEAETAPVPAADPGRTRLVIRGASGSLA